MREPSAMLVAMPWHALGLPSIQLGILGCVLEQAGIATEVNQNVPSLVLAKMLKQQQPSLAVVFGGGNCDGVL
jgi:hypothetical protein